MEYQTFAIIAAVVAIVAIVLYVWERRTKQQSVEWTDAAKLGVGAGSIAGGVAYAMGAEGVADTVERVAEVASAAQEMFVGKPEF